MKDFFELLKVADTFTLLNALFGTFSMYASMMQRYTTAVVFILLSVVFDFLDGKVARKTKTNVFGRELDSLADIISFGAAPVVFGFSQIQTDLAKVAFVVFLLCGILRLARFNVMKMKDFMGMPITMNGIIIPLVYFANVPLSYYPYIFFVLAVLMVLPVKIKKVI